MSIISLPADVLAVVAEACHSGKSSVALACCSSELQAALHYAKPLVSLTTYQPESALSLESGGMWRLRSLVLIGSEAEMQKVGCSSHTWDVFAIAASAQAVSPKSGDPPPPSRPAMPLALLAGCEWLADITLDGTNVDEEGLCELASVPHLECASLRRVKLSSLSPLSLWPRLTTLELASCWRILDLSALAACERLAHLTLQRYKGCGLVASASLECVTIVDADRLTDLWALSSCPRLRRVACAVCHEVEDLSPLADCSSLVDLSLDRCLGVRSVAPLQACARLSTLTLSRCPRLTDLSALAACASLHQLEVFECSGLTNFASPCRVAQALVRMRAAVPAAHYL